MHRGGSRRIDNIPNLELFEDDAAMGRPKSIVVALIGQLLNVVKTLGSIRHVASHVVWAQ